MTPLAAFNLGLRFLIELAALAAVGVWGAQAGSGTALHVALAIAAPIAAASVWGAFVAPKAAVRVREVVRVAIELAVFAAAAAGLAAAGHPTLAVAFGAVAVANGVLVRLLHPSHGG